MTMLSKKHRTILNAIFCKPVQAGIAWKDIESLLKALGAELSEGNGSRIRIALNGRRAVFHRECAPSNLDKLALRLVLG